MKTNNKKKIAIIGGGITGLYLARKLAERNHEVQVFEAKEKIGKQSCSGLISDRILNFIPSAENFADNKISKAKIHLPRKTTTLEFSHDFLVIDRTELDPKIADLARAAGAEIVTGRYVKAIPQGFDYVLGCDGAKSKVRNILDLKKMNYRLGIKGYTEQESSESLVKTWPVPRGFIWRIPRGKKTEYGIIAPRSKATELFDDFLNGKDLELNRKSADLIGQGLNLSANEKVALCGEAAGLTKGWSGGGVIWGLKAADLLLENFPNLDEYRQQVRRFFGTKIFVTNLATKLVYKIGFNLPALLPEHKKVDSDFLIS